VPSTGATPASKEQARDGPRSRNGVWQGVTLLVSQRSVRSPGLYRVLRNFCLGSFFALADELEAGADLPVALEEHGGPNRPTLYEYRPLVGAFVEQRAGSLGTREDALDALAALKDEPAAGIFARAHASTKAGEDEALRRTILIPLVERTAERCGGFNWDDAAFDHTYAELELSLFGERRVYAALAPLVGLTAGGEIPLGATLRVRPVASGEFQASWPEAGRLLPRDYGREVDRMLLIELERELDTADPTVPDSPAEVGRAISALRLATPGAIAAGPVLFERLDWRPYNVRPVPPLAAQVPPGEATRLDPFRGRLASEIVRRLELGPYDPDLLEAVERFEIALFANGPHRADELREALVALLGGEEGSWAAAMRATALLGETPRERTELLSALRALVDGDGPGARAEDAVRRALVESLLAESRESLIGALDEALLGLRPRPQVTTSARVLAVS
jgi:hypothetical protein